MQHRLKDQVLSGSELIANLLVALIQLGKISFNIELDYDY